MRGKIAVVFSFALAAFLACTGEDPDLPSSPTDASTDASTNDGDPTTDAGSEESLDAGPRCNPTAAFQTPTPLEGIGTPDHELSASLSDDELTMYFSRRALDAGENSELYVTTRTSRDATFGPPTLLALVNSAYEDDNITTTGDALTVYFHSRRLDGGGLEAPDIFRAERPSLMTALTPPTPVGINTSAFDGDPFIMPDGKTLYFTSTRSGPFRIYRSEQTADGGFATAFEMSELYAVDAGQKDIGQPILTPDGKTLYFASGVNTNYDVWVATRLDTLGAFSDLHPVENVNLSTANDVPSWASRDGCLLVFRSGRPGGAGGEDLWLARRGF
jgi:hypothetical protein